MTKPTQTMARKTYHEPVMLKESTEALCLDPDGTYVDATYGGGGHSRGILSHLRNGRVFAFDQDADSQGQLDTDGRITFIRQNFRFLSNFLKMHNAIPVDGILADLGVSSHQIDTPDRGFSFREKGPLDMRMDQSQEFAAVNVINEYDENDLVNIFREYGELRNAPGIAGKIIKAREKAPLSTIEELVDCLEPLIPERSRHKFLARLFQALRIEVNGELDALKSLLLQSEEVLRENGRLAVITYHSLEDRLVKNYIRSGNFRGIPEKDFYGNVLRPFEAVNRKPISPTESEIAQNNRARSAKLRVARKIAKRER